MKFKCFMNEDPRYISPEELTTFIFNKINESSIKNKKILKKANI